MGAINGAGGAGVRSGGAGTPGKDREAEGAQLRLGLGPEAPHWSCTRPFAGAPHRRRLLERLEAARSFFPELDGATIRVGLVHSERVLGRGSLDPETPAIWLRPRAGLFTMAHELTHLLQARRLLPGGEPACDLFALARSPLLVDSLPTYLRLPDAVPREEPPAPWLRVVLHRAALQAAIERQRGRWDYLRSFRRSLERALTALSVQPPLTAGTMEISLPSGTGVASPPV